MGRQCGQSLQNFNSTEQEVHLISLPTLSVCCYIWIVGQHRNIVKSAVHSRNSLPGLARIISTMAMDYSRYFVLGDLNVHADLAQK